MRGKYMTKSWKRVSALVLAVLMLMVSVMTGCGSSENAQLSAGDEQSVSISIVSKEDAQDAAAQGAVSQDSTTEAEQADGQYAEASSDEQEWQEADAESANAEATERNFASETGESQDSSEALQDAETSDAGAQGTETQDASSQDSTAEAEMQTEAELSVVEDGSYTSKDEVALYIHEFGHLPGNFISKRKAEKLGWDSREGNLWEVAPGKSIGGSRFGNYEGLLPEDDDRTYYECDIDYDGGYRGAKRIIYSDDGLVFYTEDHYKTFEQLY
ncbi:MAG: ribonuclease domain-containing protein [Eubacteriales bacterium]|nr:ribonuclease domain-containing protein [Eubacteriales bacterium]